MNKEIFSNDGFYVIKKFANKKQIYCDLPKDLKERGKITYFGRNDSYLQEIDYDNHAVPYSLTRYNYPFYQTLLEHVKNFLTENLKVSITKSLCYDRFYFKEQFINSYNIDNEYDLIFIIESNKNFNKKSSLILSNKKLILLEFGDALVFDLRKMDCERNSFTNRKFDPICKLFLGEQYSHEICFAFKID